MSKRIDFYKLNSHEKALKRKFEEKEKIKDDYENIDKIETELERLNDKEELFCLYYSKKLNATQSYIKVYDCSYETARRNSHKLMKRESIRAEIARLKEEKIKAIMISEEDIVYQHIKIAFSDMTDYVEFGTEKGSRGKTNYLRFKESIDIDGTIVSKIKHGKETMIQLEDRQKSLDWLANYFNMNQDSEFKKMMEIKYYKHKIYIENQKIEIMKEKLKNDNNDEDNDENIRKFLEATKKNTQELERLFDKK